MDLLSIEHKRRAYFQSQGYGEPPEEQAERYALARSLCAQEMPDLEGAYALYDPLADCQHTPFLYLLSTILGKPGTRLYDPEQARLYARKAYIYASKDQQEDAAQNYVNVQGSTPASLLRAGSDLVLMDAMAALIGKGVEPQAFRYDGNSSLADFAAAVFQSGGHGMVRDDRKATAAYERYIQTQPKGFLALAYQNLALRYALGLGTAPNPDVACTLLETAEFLLDDGEGIFKDLRKYLREYSKKMEIPIYVRTCSALRNGFITNDSLWPMMNVARGADPQSHEAIIDTINLYAMLAHAENWREPQDWDSVRGFAQRHFSRIGLWTNIRSVNHLNEVNAFYSGIEQESSRLTLTSQRHRMFAHFVRYKLGIPPLSSSDRFSLQYEFTQKIPPQYDHAYALFDEDADSGDRDWLAAIAYILDEHLNNEALFDPVKAEKLNRRAADLGSAIAAFNLGVKYHTGQETEINLDEAIRWYQRADELGNKLATTRIASILKFQKDLDFPENERKIPDEVICLYDQAYHNFVSGQSPYIKASFELAKLALSGYEFPTKTAYGTDAIISASLAKKNLTAEKQTDAFKTYALKMYHKIIACEPVKTEAVTHAQIAYILAVRAFFGLDTERDIRKAEEYLNHIPDQSNDSYIRYTLQEYKQHLKRCITADCNISNPDLEIIKRLCNNSEKIPEFIRQLDNKQIKPGKIIANYIVCIKHLSQLEEWRYWYDWDSMLEAVQAHQLGFTFAQAVESTKDSGPRYTPLDERGLPILGVYQKPSIDEIAEQAQKTETGSYVPQPGLIHLNKIRADKNGIHYGGAYSEDLPAMLTPEDLQIAEILVFGEPAKGPIFPSLSLETENNDEYGKGAEGNGYDKAFTYKIFTPQWLAYTDFGRTLWITDYLIGQWCWNPEKFHTGTHAQTATPYMHRLGKELIRSLRLTGGRDGGASSARVMIQPKTAFITPKVPSDVYKQDAVSVEIKQMSMKVYGSYILNDGRIENRSLFEEDPNFAQGRTVKKLTDRYNDIMQLDPRFERAQQLMALFYGLFRTWELGYRPSEEFQQELTYRLHAMQSLGRARSESLLVRRSFGLRPY